MKIATLNSPIKHERKIEFDDDRFDALDAAFSELCSLEEVAEALIETLKKVNPLTKEVIVVEHTCLISLNDTLKEVDIRGFSFPDLFTSLIAAVIG